MNGILLDFSIATLEILARYGMLCKFKAIYNCNTHMIFVVAKFFVDIDNTEGSH